MPALSDPKFVQFTGGGLVFRENRKPDRETERERERRGSCCDSRHVEEIYSRGRGARIAYADRCAHLRSSFFGAVSSVHECSTFASTSVFSRKLVNGQSRIMLGIGGDESFTRNVCKELDEVWEGRKEGRKR